MTLLHYLRRKNAQNQQHLLHILSHYLSHQLQMLHEVENFPLRDLQKHYIKQTKNYIKSNTTGNKLSVQVNM